MQGLKPEMNDVSIVLAGAAGQGIETVAAFMANILKLSGFEVFVTREFMSRIRGGTNSLQLRVSTRRVGAYTLKTDIFVPFSEDSIPHLAQYSRLQDQTTFIGEKRVYEGYNISSKKIINVPFSKIAMEVGNRIYINTVAAGVISGLFQVEEEVAASYLTQRFIKKGEKIVKENIQAFRRGREIGSELLNSGRLVFEVEKLQGDEEKLLMTGTEAIALGAIAGGCNFISSYPMSPSTGVLTFLAQKSKDFGIIIDQAEDEISAINKGIGAWYAGARAMVTTSGGGFALMTEGLSLAGMIESPMVVHLAQRPGPATGLPTRTEQGDLMHVLNAGHGEFPRIILSPCNPEDAFTLTQKSFNMADKYQVPVIILTDQFFLDSSFGSSPIDLSIIKNEKYFIKTEQDYKRYQQTVETVSPRGIPGWGEGTVGVDSDEHDEQGHITEDLNLRVQMVDKRLRKKLELIRTASIPPEFYGEENYKVLALSWGSNYYVLKEAIDNVGKKGISMLSFNQVYPLNEKVSDYLESAEKLVLIENNATAQFGKVLQLETGFTVPKKNILLSYNGLPFPVERVTDFLQCMIRYGCDNA
jgi:2-oxoglutarate ferredoxin oxidoreductase subunit alpha